MKDDNGVKAQVVADARQWECLDLNDIESSKQFEPTEYCEIVIFRDDGTIYRHVLA
jgi:hypothetical protein